MHASVSVREVVIVLRLHFREMALESFSEVQRQHCASIFASLAVPHRNLRIPEVDIFDP